MSGVHKGAMSTTDDPQDLAEALDEAKIDVEKDFGDDYPEDYPPDQPLSGGTDEIEPSAPESASRASLREEPDPLVAELDRAAAERERGPDRTATERLLDDLDVEVPDDEFDQPVAADLVDDLLDEAGDEFDDNGATPAPLIDPTPGFDDEPQAVADEGDDSGDESAEEAAMHIEHEA